LSTILIAITTTPETSSFDPARLAKTKGRVVLNVERTSKMPRCSLRIVATLLLLPLAICRKDRNVFHGHRGKLAPQKAGPMEGVKLSAGDLDTLRAGRAVMKQVQNGDKAGTAICIQDVDAPVAAVWFQILDLPNYTKKVSKVKESTNYVVKKQVLGVLPGYTVSRESPSFAQTKGSYAHLTLPTFHLRTLVLIFFVATTTV
jgi:hypothetical protein